jgi:tetratricopeptide (TPR) repeat protein
MGDPGKRPQGRSRNGAEVVDPDTDLGIVLPPPRKPPPLPESEPMAIESDQIDLDQPIPVEKPPLPEQLTQVPIVPPPPPRRRTTIPPPPPGAPLAHQERSPSEKRKATPPPSRPGVDLWRNEVDALKLEADALKDRDPARAALLHGAIAQISETLLGEDPAGAQALDAASKLSTDRWIAMFCRRDAIVAQKWVKALDLMRAELPQVGDPRERVSLLLEIGTVEETVKGDKDAARQALEEAREIDPAHAGVLEALAQLYYAAQEWDHLVNVLQSMADATLDVIHRSMVRHTLGLIHDVHLKNPQAARAAYKLSLVDDPANLAAAVSLQSLALKQEDWVELARVLVLEADLIGDPRSVRRLCERAGDLYWERLGDAESAIQAYRKAARATPEEQAPLRKLANVLESVGRWRELVEVYQAELPLTRDPEERGDLFFRVGEVHEAHLAHIEEAVTAWQSALEAAPTHLPTLQALGALYQNTERWAELVQMDLHEVEKVSDPKRRANRYFEIAQLIERRIGDQDEAVRLYQRAFELSTGHRGAFASLDRLYRREEKWSELVRLYEKQAGATSDPQLVRFFRQEAGRLWRERLSNADKAASAMREALAVDAPDLSPLLQLAGVLEGAQKWEALTQTLEQLQGKLKDEADVIGTLHRLAAVLEQELGQEERALAVHERVLERAPANESSLRAVGRLYHRAGRWPQVIHCFERQLQHCQNADEKASIRYRIGRIYERKLGKRDEAITSYEQALGDSPRYSPAFRALDRLLRRDKMWPRLLTVLTKQAEAERTPIARAQDFYATGQIQELHLRDLKAAEKAYASAVKLVPTYEAAVAALAQVHEARNDWPMLDQYLGEILQRTTDPNARLSVMIRIGLLCELRLNDPGRAALFYRDGIEAAALGRTLLAAELRAARSEQGAKGTAHSLVRVGSRATDPRLRAGYQLLAALRDEVVSRPPNSLLAIEAAELGRGDPGAIDALIRALMRDSSADSPTPRLADAFTERAQSCGSAPARALLLLDAAFLFERLGSPRDAALAYEDAGRAVSELLPVLRGMRRLAMSNEQWPAVVAILSREAEVAAHKDNRAAAYLMAGEIATTHLNDTRGALAQYRRLLELEPEHERAYLRATALLERLGDYQGLYDVLAARASAAKDPEARAVILRRQAEIQRDHLNDPGGAVATLKQAIALHQDIDAYLMLAPLQEQQRWWQDAAHCWRQIADLTAGNEVSRTARMREAEIRERELGDREAARSILEELVVDPDDREAAGKMAELCERMGEWVRARDLYTHLAQTSKKLSERAGHLMSLASVLESGFSDQNAGQRAIDEAFALALGDGEVVAGLELRFGVLGDWRGYVAAGERAFAAARVVAPPQASLRLSLARVYNEELRRSDLAARQLAAAAELSPQDPTAVVRLGKMHVEGGRPELATPQFRRALAIDPLNPSALRGLGTALLHEGVPDAGQMFDELAAWLETGHLSPNPLQPRVGRRAITPDDIFGVTARGDINMPRPIRDLLRLLEPYAPQILVEATGRIPRGDELPDANQLAMRCRAIASVMGVQPMRVFIDPPEGREARLVADDKLAMCVSKELTRSDQLGVLVFEVTRQIFFVSSQVTLGALTGAGDLMSILQAVAQEEGSDYVKDLRRRVLKFLPRRVRKDAERLVVDGKLDLPRACAEWHADEHRWADRLGLLLGRDAVGILRAVSSDDPRALKRSPRAFELIRWMNSEAFARAYLRLNG